MRARHVVGGGERASMTSAEDVEGNQKAVKIVRNALMLYSLGRGVINLIRIGRHMNYGFVGLCRFTPIWL